jgi:hypothetical protein
MPSYANKPPDIGAVFFRPEKAVGFFRPVKVKSGFA